MKGLKIFQIGCGKMSKYTMRYVYEREGYIVGAVDINEDIIGKDIGTIMECENKGVVVKNLNELENLLNELKPDAAIVTTMSLMSDLEDVLKTCARCGVNAISTCEEAFYPINSSPRITKEIDAIAKENNCTITGSGYQDVFWGNLISVIAGSTHRITKIKGSSSYNVEDYGIALAEAHGAGLTLEEFETNVASADNISDEERNILINNREFMPSYMWNTVGWLADKLNLNIIKMSQKCIPITHDEEIHSDTLQMDIPAGRAIGMSAVVKAETKEGILLEAECIGKVYAPDVVDRNEWTIYGEPDTNVVVSRPCTVELTCADIVNRIPDVINSKAGFVPTSQMSDPNYRVLPLNEYLK